MHEVVAPHVVHVFCSQPDARPIIEPQTAFPGLFLRNLQPFTMPQAFNPLVIDMPTRITQQRCNTAVAISTILSGKFDHISDEALFIFSAPGHVALCSAMLTKYAAGPAFRDAQPATYLINALAPTCRA